jgi:hypothetical protein
MAGFEVITYGRFWVIAEGKLPKEQQSEALRRWTETASLQTTLDHRMHQRVAGTVLSLVGPS